MENREKKDTEDKSETVEIDIETIDTSDDSKCDPHTESSKCAEDEAQCYCNEEKDGLILKCEQCKRVYHISCLKSGPPSSLEGDDFFKLLCEHCSPDKTEETTRTKLTWQQVVILTLYNLGLRSSGRMGYFRWKEDICSFIDKNWHTFFGARVRTSTFHGTVAGVLSTGNKVHFKSGAHEFGEAGWWALVENRPPLKPDTNAPTGHKMSALKRQRIPFEPTIKVEGLRTRKRATSVESAIELKEKRSRTQEAKDIRKAKQVEPKRQEDSKECVENLQQRSGASTPTVPDSPSVLSLLGAEDSSDSIVSSMLSESDLTPEATLPAILMTGDVEPDDDDLDLDLGTGLVTSSIAGVTTTMSSTLQDLQKRVDDAKAAATMKSAEREDIVKNEEDEDDESSGEETISEKIVEKKKEPSRPRRVKHSELPSKEEVPRILPMSLYEEKQLLKKLESCSDAVAKNPQVRTLRRKLLIRQEKRARGLPIFDLDDFMMKSMQKVCNVSTANRSYNITSLLSSYNITSLNPYNISMRHAGDFRVLDRFQVSQHTVKAHQVHYSSFRARLIGSEVESNLQSICSPYTARVLKPFIRRDFESRPLKMVLMQEIWNYRTRIEPGYDLPSPAPIDYCYVRPHHVPSVNVMCREFFWPGIDLSETLQYPDFSVVALYRKVVIGFGFMVPDVKYNEAYISFLLVHPEWRNAGIGTFMVYHLIQTCMGKDLTLHVSATNPAMLLYQKFGFKPEEFILDFYDKYYEEDSKECKHSFFLRLRR
ncbi:cysteine-rich protein 2-binding protein-like [Saccoglossus kowalevskii]|uniref:Cysteine-rich protein 2-binding protein-like n=1 Tax=Saccoglossus kowalevskii TaxID=10224 RepID=A0ABM0MQU8_SACKO|nr:PREDICTED: cysteine-rich protein 2-binding protein-like [Saccoglossus kowalevskii]